MLSVEGGKRAGPSKQTVAHSRREGHPLLGSGVPAHLPQPLLQPPTESLPPEVLVEHFLFTSFIAAWENPPAKTRLNCPFSMFMLAAKTAPLTSEVLTSGETGLARGWGFPCAFRLDSIHSVICKRFCTERRISLSLVPKKEIELYLCLFSLLIEIFMISLLNNVFEDYCT